MGLGRRADARGSPPGGRGNRRPLRRRCRDPTGQPPAIHIREGKSRDELIKLLGEDRSICVLVLGSSSSNEGPGPLVAAFTGKAGAQLRIPLTIVPGALSEAEIDAIS